MRDLGEHELTMLPCLQTCTFSYFRNILLLGNQSYTAILRLHVQPAPLKKELRISLAAPFVPILYRDPHTPLCCQLVRKLGHNLPNSSTMLMLQGLMRA